MNRLPRTRAWGATRRGAQHQVNEDSYCLVPDDTHIRDGRTSRGALYAVCDGVSSGGEGLWASNLACDRLAHFFDSSGDPDLPSLIQLVGEIDWEIRGQGKGKAACTLAGLWVDGDKAHVMQVGDSRIYRIRGDDVMEVTLKEGQGRQLDEFLGMGPDVSNLLQVRDEAVSNGDVFVLLTDGVTEVLDTKVLAGHWQRSKGDPAACTQAILGEVVRCGAKDDATVVVVFVLSGGAGTDASA